MHVSLGAGSYGTVAAVNGEAVKTVTRVSHAVQEYVALQGLRDADRVVKARGVSVKDMTIKMDLYDMSLREWIIKHWNYKDAVQLSKDVIIGLVQIHDTGQVHGDLKPGNILVCLRPLTAVIGDCGFTSTIGYAKVDRTAPVYRELDITNDVTHDLYSLAIVLLNLLYRAFLTEQLNYDQTANLIRNTTSWGVHREVMLSLVNVDKSRRISAREALYKLHGAHVELSLVPVPKRRLKVVISDRSCKFMRYWLKTYCAKYNIQRGSVGYTALIYFLHRHRVEPKSYLLYTSLTLLVISSMFGARSFRIAGLMTLTGNMYTEEQMHEGLEKMLADVEFVDQLRK